MVFSDSSDPETSSTSHAFVSLPASSQRSPSVSSQRSYPAPYYPYRSDPYPAYPTYPAYLPYQSYRPQPYYTPYVYSAPYTHTPAVPSPSPYNLQHRAVGSPRQPEAEVPPPTTSSAPKTARTYDDLDKNRNPAYRFDAAESQINYVIECAVTGSTEREDIGTPPRMEVYTRPTFNHGDNATKTEVYEIFQTELFAKSDDRNHDIATLRFEDKDGLYQPETRWM
ncbi:hypothetical protein N7454_008220 [Penicillium verhagenii]|nr:hypothetical protein N7454_008220 [Penicillium verhagenii]